VHAIPNADAHVGGQTAIAHDIRQATTQDNMRIFPLVLIVVLIVLALLLRAIVAPLLLVATVVLSFGTALGLSSLLFQHAFGWVGEDASLPLFVFVFLVALGIDYNIFLMTRVREEAARFGTRRGAVVGLAATGAVITSAVGVGRYLRRAGHSPAGGVRRDRPRRGARGHPRHDRRTIDPRYRAHAGRRSTHVVAEQAVGQA
jgi:hypothetical protein